MEVADADRAAFYVAGERDAVDIGIGAGDVESSRREAEA
jgi:hypothetical protein